MREYDYNAVIAAVKAAGEHVSQLTSVGDVKKKGPTDFVTDVDVSVQRLLAGELAKIAPEVQFMGEEKDNSDIDFKKDVWILDPIDGTTNLVHGFHFSSISLALASGGKVVFGAVYNPFSGEMFTARLGHGACLNGSPIHVSAAGDVSQGLIIVGTAPGYRERADYTFKVMRAIYDMGHDIRRVGSAALELCYVACGRAEGFLECSLKPWDYSAGGLIVREAGGVTSTFDGSPLSISNGGSVVGANCEKVLGQLRSVL